MHWWSVLCDCFTVKPSYHPFWHLQNISLPYRFQACNSNITLLQTPSPPPFHHLARLRAHSGCPVSWQCHQWRADGSLCLYPLPWVRQYQMNATIYASWTLVRGAHNLLSFFTMKLKNNWTLPPNWTMWRTYQTFYFSPMNLQSSTFSSSPARPQCEVNPVDLLRRSAVWDVWAAGVWSIWVVEKTQGHQVTLSWAGAKRGQSGMESGMFRCSVFNTTRVDTETVTIFVTLIIQNNGLHN